MTKSISKGRLQESLLEILELEQGTLIIRHAGDERKQLITVSFADELLEALGDQYTDIARVMLTAGVQLAIEADAAEVFDTEAESTEDVMIH